MQRTDETDSRPQQKEPYTAPEIREVGQLKELTRGGSVAARGEGPGFSL